MEEAAVPGTDEFAANCRRLAGAFKGARYRTRKAPVEALFAVVEERSAILERLPDKYRIVPFLIRIAMHQDDWVRPPQEWAPSVSIPFAQVSDLMAHLFERYPVPRFFERVWWPGDRKDLKNRNWLAFAWYVHVGAGRSIRTAPGLPTDLTRAAAHHMMLAPAKVSPIEAIRWGQVRAAGASGAIAEAILATTVARDFSNERLWRLFFSKLADAPELPPHQVGPLVDYVREAAKRDGFRLNGRTVPSLLRAMERWHDQLRAVRRFPSFDVSWPRLEGVEPYAEEHEDGLWCIEEITNVVDLHAEGARMRHCVFNYASSCRDGSQSIWSFRRPRYRATIRVTVANRRIDEARTVSNRPIDEVTLRFLRKWAARNRLEIGRITTA